jgi:CheY-like chemotaxis protein
VSKYKLLLADDSITIQKVVNLTFADEGIEVISVGDGNSAMEKFEEFTPDLVMADINMPGLSGYEICERIKSSDATRRIPVILLVGSFEPFDEREAQRVGANDYLTKPFQSIRQLVSKVSDLLNSSANGEENPAPSENYQTPPNSFDDTLDMEKPSSDSDELGDAGMDDEMIQASPVDSFQFDETHKYESHSEPEFEDYGKTQPLSGEEFDEINSPQTQAATDLSNQNISGFTGQDENEAQEFSGEEINSTEGETKEFSSVDENEFSVQTGESQTSPMPSRASILELDDMDLLELPPRKSFSTPAPAKPVVEDNFVPEVETSDSTAEPTQETEETTQFEQSEAEEITTADSESRQSESGQIANLSPEIIDAIAAKVVEKISDKVIREIAWEVVPQMTDLIVKRLAEEKLRE